MNRPVRVLVVEDYAPFRELLRATLEQMSEFEVVGESSDGLEAVQKARKLNPDLILVDIGLPRLNGFAVTRQIKGFSAHAIVLIVTEVHSRDMVEHAFLSGANGYLVKSDAAGELESAVEAVLQGKQFISTLAALSMRD